MELKDIQESPMVPEIKAKWLEALRSGEFRQTSGVLEKVNSTGVSSYCCLGVLSHLAHEDGLIERHDDGGGTYRYGVEGDWNTAFLSRAVCEWAGLENRAGQYGADNDMALVDHNDNGDTFSEIADIIEAHF